LSFAEDDDPDPEPEPRSLRRTDVECWAAFGVIMADATSDEEGREIGEGVANNQLLAAVVAAVADEEEDEDNLLKGVVTAADMTPAPPGLPASAALEVAGERGKSAAAARDAEDRAGEEVEEGGDISVEAERNSGMLLAGRDAAAAAATTAAAAVAAEQGGAANPAAAFGAGLAATTVMATVSSASARSLRFTFCASRGDALGAAVGAAGGVSSRAAALLLLAAGAGVTHAADARRGDRARVVTADDGGLCSDEGAPVCPVVDVSAILSDCVVPAPGAALLAATGAARGGMSDTEVGAGRTEHEEGACSRSLRAPVALCACSCARLRVLAWRERRREARRQEGEERRTGGGQTGAGADRLCGLNAAPSQQRGMRVADALAAALPAKTDERRTAIWPAAPRIPGWVRGRKAEEQSDAAPQPTEIRP
jgi:hypothetical protein